MEKLGGTTGALDQEITEREEEKETTDVLCLLANTQTHRNCNQLSTMERERMYIYKGNYNR